MTISLFGFVRDDSRQELPTGCWTVADAERGSLLLLFMILTTAVSGVQELEARVLRALRERFFVGDTFAEFCAAFTAETNRIRIEQRASLSSIKHELAHVKHDIEKVIDAIVQGYAGPELKERMAALQVRKGALTAQLASADAPLPLLHPSMADDFGRKVEALTTTLTTGDQHGAAREALRGLIDKVVVPPGDGLLMIHGNLGKMLEASGGKDCKNGCGGSPCTKSASLLDSSLGPFLLLFFDGDAKWTILVGATTRALLMIARATSAAAVAAACQTHAIAHRSIRATYS